MWCGEVWCGEVYLAHNTTQAQSADGQVMNIIRGKVGTWCRRNINIIIPHSHKKQQTLNVII